jgi:hypothetical protein
LISGWTDKYDLPGNRPGGYDRRSQIASALGTPADCLNCH